MRETLRLERMVHGGVALARLESGRVALIRGGIPGELVISDLREVSGVLQGEVVELLASSPDRIDSPEHPGLDYGHIRYERQLELKREVVKDALSRSLKREVRVSSPVAAPDIWGYRSSVQPVATKEGLGYRKPGTHEVVLLERDPVANEAIQGAWQRWQTLKPPKGIRDLVFRGNDRGEVLMALIATASPKNYLSFAHELLDASIVGVSYAAFDKRGRFRRGSERLAGKRNILQRYGQFDLSVNASSFAQPSPAAASQLYAALVEMAARGKLALDLYAGSGVIGMHLASRFEQVIALEIDRSSVVRGEKDAERLGIDGLAFVKADARRLDIPAGTELICVDPPRAGLNKEVRGRISASKVPQLIYVSCDVATWARDVASFEQEGWHLAAFTPFDFYPHTHHIELLSLLTR